MSTQPSISTRKGRPKGDKRARTRTKLVAAAIELIRERGYEETTLANVAERAGMTTGAIYGNFRNRTDLLMAVAEVSGAPIQPKTWPGMTFRDLMHETAEAVIASLPQRRAAMAGTLGFHLQTLAHEDLRERSVTETREIYRRYAAGIPLLIPPDQLPMRADLLIPVLRALTDGLVLHCILTPELVGKEAIHAAFDALAGQASGGELARDK